MLLPIWRHIHGAFQRMPRPWLKVIIFTTNYMPAGQCISIRVKIILVMVYNLPALLVILCGAVCIPPAITIMVPSYLIFRPLHQRPVRTSITINPAVIQTVLLTAYRSAVGNHLAASAGVALNGPNLGHGDLIDDTCMADALGVFKKYLVTWLRVVLMVLALGLIVLCGCGGIGRKTSSQELPGRHLTKGLDEAPVHKHVTPRLPLNGWIQVSGILGVVATACISGLAVKLAVTAFLQISNLLAGNG